MILDRRSGAVAAGLITTLILVVGALSRHPQGNLARVTPYVVAAGLVWVAVAATVAGSRAALKTACVVAAPALLAVAVYAFFVEPIRFAECGPLVTELSDPACRSHAPLVLLLVSAGGSFVATTALVTNWRKAQ